jgi:hypothetical protein
MKKIILDNLYYVLFVVFCYFIYFLGSYAFDFYARPWAYSSDKNAKLFVGKWAGQFKDPDGVSKKIALEIFVPMENSERVSNALTCGPGKSKSKSKKAFEGTATVKSALGTEDYEVWGYFADTDFHQFSMHERIKKALPVANFYLQQTEADCVWKGDDMTLILPFYYQKANGSGYSSSDDARFSQKATVVMKRE